MRQCWLKPALAVLLAAAAVTVNAQGIVYGHFPASPEPHTTSYDSEGWRLFSTPYVNPATYDLTINGQVAYTFVAAINGFRMGYAPSLNAVISIPVGNIGGGFGVPLTAGELIGSDAAGYTWIPVSSGVVLQSTLSLSGDSGLFTGVESAYLGLQFQQDGTTYYGWARIGSPYGYNGGWLYDYAYETSPDTPILTGAVPEPSTFALFGVGCAMLCGTLWLLRKLSAK